MSISKDRKLVYLKDVVFSLRHLIGVQPYQKTEYVQGKVVVLWEGTSIHLFNPQDGKAVTMYSKVDTEVVIAEIRKVSTL